MQPNLPVKEIVKLTGYSKNSVYKVLLRHGHIPVKEYHSKLNITLHELAELRDKGLSFRQIGELYGVSWKTVRDLAIKMGVYVIN